MNLWLFALCLVLVVVFYLPFEYFMQKLIGSRLAKGESPTKYQILLWQLIFLVGMLIVLFLGMSTLKYLGLFGLQS